MELTKNLKSDILTLAAMALGIAGLFFSFRASDKSAAEKAHAVFLIPPGHLKYFSLGYNEILADSLWLRVIQDFDHCEGEPTAKKKGPINCAAMDRGWVYHMLDAVTELAPHFRMPYIHGGSMLSVVLADKEGARLLYDRALVNFPSDWKLEYQAAYHYLYELHDSSKAGELLAQAGKNGAPRWVFSLAARLLSEQGKDLFAKSMLESVIEANPDASFTPRLQQRLDEINQKLKAQSAP
jgi:hypothetical protein